MTGRPWSRLDGINRARTSRAMKKPSSPPSASSRPGRMRTQPSGDGGTKSGSRRLGGRARNRRCSARKARDHLLALLRLERADRIDQRPAGLQPLRGAGEQPRLQLGAVGDDRRPRAIEDFGVAAERAGRRAGRVEQDRVELALGLPLSARRRRRARRRGACARDSRAVVARRLSDESTAVTRWPAAASCMVLPPGAAQRSSTSVASAGISRAGSEAARSCTHQRPSPKPGKLGDRRAVEADMAAARARCRRARRIGLRFRIVGEGEVERRALGDLAPRGLDDVLAPGRAPALLDLGGKVRRVASPARRGGAACRARRGPAAAGRRRPAAARSRPARDRACRGRSSAQARGAAPSAPCCRRAGAGGSRCRSAHRGRAGGAAPRRQSRRRAHGRAATGREPAPPPRRASGRGEAPHRASAAPRGARRRPQCLAWRLAIAILTS